MTDTCCKPVLRSFLLLSGSVSLYTHLSSKDHHDNKKATVGLSIIRRRSYSDSSKNIPLQDIQSARPRSSEDPVAGRASVVTSSARRTLASDEPVGAEGARTAAAPGTRRADRQQLGHLLTTIGEFLF